MDVQKIVAQLGEASDADLTAALAEIDTQGRALAQADLSEENVVQLEALASAKGLIRAEVDNRSSLAARSAAARSAFADDTDGDSRDDGDTTDSDSGDGTGSGQSDSDRDAQIDGAPPRPTGDDQPDGRTADGMQASGKAKLGQIGKAVAKAPAPAAKATTLAVSAKATSLADLPSLPAGTAITDRWALAEAMTDLSNRLGRSTVRGKQYVARFTMEYPEERTLRSDVGAGVNTAKIEAVTEPTALVAAGGLCAPLETRYEIDVLGVTDRPIRDALARFAVDRGGIQYRMPMDALVMTDGLGIWTVDDDAVADDPEDPAYVEKTCAIIDCPDVVDAVVYSTYLCLQYPNFTARFDREWVDATNRAAMVAWARFAENQLLARILAGSKLLHQEVVVSATRDVLVAIDKTVAYYRNRHRLDTMVPLRLILPRWVLDLFRADIARGFPGDLDALAVADATILSWFRARGVNVTFHLDGLAGATVNAQVIPNQFYANAAAGAAIPEFIDRIDAALFAEGDWLYLDGGTLDLGLVRDSALNRINRYQQFVENFEGVAFNGVESLRLVMTVHPRGAVVGTIPVVATATDFPED